ncbi:hypothetical protein AAVH_25713, partial [Aphelenchoides avenae]
ELSVPIATFRTAEEVAKPDAMMRKNPKITQGLNESIFTPNRTEVIPAYDGLPAVYTPSDVRDTSDPDYFPKSKKTGKGVVVSRRKSTPDEEPQ